jgi:Arabinose-binding domain of AraC transcription regulator, N-term
MSKGTSSDVNSEQDLASIPMAQGGLTRLAIERLKSAGVPVAPLLKRAGLTPELIADPEQRLSVRSQIALLDEAANALKTTVLASHWLAIMTPAKSGCCIMSWRLRRP